MKQYITKKQWSEISEEQQKQLAGEKVKKDQKVSIGDMIEFLGDGWNVNAIRQYLPYNFKNSMVPNSELCDKLWEMVKIKLG
jgi:hypothetical protein